MILYSKPNCPNCVKLKAYFKKNTIDFTEIDITQDDTAMDKLISAGLRTLPVVELDGELLPGMSLIQG